jgi:rubredoxin
MPNPQTVPVQSEILRRQSLEAIRITACTDCGAPGVYKSDSSIEAGWPGCYVEPGDSLDTKPVGYYCPNCGAARSQDENLSEIWSREWMAQPRRSRLLNWLINLFR